MAPPPTAPLPDRAWQRTRYRPPRRPSVEYVIDHDDRHFVVMLDGQVVASAAYEVDGADAIQPGRMLALAQRWVDGRHA